MNRLLAGMKEEFNWTTTENGARTYKSTMNSVLDLFAQAPARRGQNITKLWESAYNEDALLALKVAFYVRDIRGGQGERNVFIQILQWLKVNRPAVFNALVPIVPEYGRWKDIVEFVDVPLVVELISQQLYVDLFDAQNDRGNVSLLAKWMPSANTSSKATRDLAHKWIKALDMTPKRYRDMLVFLRRKIGIVERAMSAREWGSINYEHVPSRASLLYRKAFGKRDGDRYGKFLEAVKRGEKTIKAATLYPYDLVEVYTRSQSGYGTRAQIDDTVEAQWKALPNYADTDENILVMVDVSGSMFSAYNKPLPINVSVSLGIYAAERNTGAFKDNFITFSAKPELITLRGTNLRDKVEQVFSAGVGYNTNIQASFDMLLRVAQQKNVPQYEMPTKIFIVSDMEFDDGNIGGTRTNFDVIARKYAAAGYTMPILVFWNVASRKTQTPVTQKQEGVFLVAGASPSILKNALNTRATTPLDLMLEVIDGDRYGLVEEALINAGF